jgi:hypothetical protein
MGSGRFDAKIPDLFSAPAREQAALPSKPPNSTGENGAASPRHVLPNDLPTAIKHLGDQELDQLQAAVTAEQQRRGRKPPASEKTVSKLMETPAVTLTIGKRNAVRAAFKAGVRPSKIAKQFGIPQSEVRRVIASEGPKR